MLVKGWGAGRHWHPAHNRILQPQWEVTCVGSFVVIDGHTQEAHGTCLSVQKGKLSPSQLTCSLDTRPQRPVRQRPGPTAHLPSPPHQLCTVSRALSALCWPESESTSEGGSAVPSHQSPTASPGMETEPLGAIASLSCLGRGITDAHRKAEGTMCPARWQVHPPVWGGSWTAEGRCCLCSRLYDSLLARQWLQQGDRFRKERRCQVLNARFRLCVSCLRAFGVGERKCDVFNRPPNYPASAQCLAGCGGRWT